MLTTHVVGCGAKTHSGQLIKVANLFGNRAHFASFAVVLWLLPSTVAATEPISFQKQVFPIIKNHCLSCHRRGGEGYEASGLSMETYEDLMKGTKYGPVIVPGSAFTSNFNVLVEGRADPSIQMPFHGERLRPLWLRILRRWVDEGAKNN